MNKTSSLVAAVKRRLTIRPIITALLAGLFAGLLYNAFTRAEWYGKDGKLLAVSYYVLAAAGLMLLIASALEIVYLVRDLRAAQNGEKRERPKKEKLARIVLWVLAALFALAASIVGAIAMSRINN